jgi:hypothetical protein
MEALVHKQVKRKSIDLKSFSVQVEQYLVIKDLRGAPLETVEE